MRRVDSPRAANSVRRRRGLLEQVPHHSATMVGKSGRLGSRYGMSRTRTKRLRALVTGDALRQVLSTRLPEYGNDAISVLDVLTEAAPMQTSAPARLQVRGSAV